MEENPTLVLQVVERQARQLVEQHQEIVSDQQQVAQLQQELESLLEQPKRSAAPFAVTAEKWQKNPKPIGTTCWASRRVVPAPCASQQR